MMRGMLAIARNTFREAIRDRILYMFLGFAILLIISSRFISMMTVGESGKIIKDLALFAIQIFGMLIAVMMSMMMISREFERKTVYTILAKPVNRLAYLLGKYLGLMAIIFVMVVLMALASVLLVFIYQFEIDLLLLFGAFMIFLELSVLCAFAVFFAVITRPILGSVLTLTTFVVGHFTGALWLLAERMKDPISQFLIPIVYYIMPNLENFNFKNEVVHHLAVPLPAVFWAFLHALLFITIPLIFAWLRFGRKDLE